MKSNQVSREQEHYREAQEHSFYQLVVSKNKSLTTESVQASSKMQRLHELR